MSEANASPAPTTSTVSPNGLSVEERAADIFGDASAPQAPAEGSAPSASAPVAPEPDEAARARAARRAAIAEATKKERERVDTATAMRERDELRARLKAAEERAQVSATHIDPSKLTKEQFFGLAERTGLTPQELGEWLREQYANPEAAAKAAAVSAVDPKLSALEKKLAEQQAVIDQFMQRQQQTAEQAAEQAAAAELYAFTKANAETSPLSAKWLEAHGEEEFLTIALSAAQSVPAHAGPQAILDEIEERLQALVSPYITASTQRTQATPPSLHQAPAKAPTNVSNTLAQQRSSVVDEAADLARLSVEERASRIFGT